MIATYALVGFANFSSIGIQIGGIGGLAPEPAQRHRPPRPARDARREPGRLHDARRSPGCCCDGEPDLVARLDEAAAVRPRAHGAASRRSASSSAPASGAFARQPRERRRRSPTAEIPHFPVSTAVGHSGELVLGTRRGVPRRGHGGPRALLRGLHASSRSCSRCACWAGSASKTLILTNAAGSVNVNYKPGRADGDRRTTSTSWACNPLIGPERGRRSASASST